MRIVYLLFIGLGLLVGADRTMAQTELNRFTHATNSEMPISTGFALANPDLNQVGVFLIDKRQIHAYALNERLDVDRKVELIKQKRTYDQIVGNLVNENGYTLFFNNRKEKAVAYLRFAFEKNGIDAKGDLPINLIAQKLIAQFKYDDQLIIMTMDKNEAIFYFHQIDKYLKHTSYQVDASGLELTGSSGRASSVDRLLIHENARIATIDLNGDKYPIGLTESSSNFKVYREQHLLYLTMDHKFESTELLIFDLRDFKLSQQTIAKPELGKTATRPKSNSFLSGENLAQIVQSNDSLRVALTNIKSKSQRAILNLSRDDTETQLSFFQKKSWKEQEKDLSTNQYFRKMKFNPLGISLSPDPTGYQLTFGSWDKSEESSSGSNAAAGVGAVFGGVVGAMISYAIAEAVSPEFQSFSRFANGKTTYTKIGLDTGFKPRSASEPGLNLFEQIERFSKTQEKQVPLVLFKFKEQSIVGMWDPKYEVMSFHGF